MISDEDRLLKRGEKVFVVERRLFEKDLRRHFVGEVEVCTASGFRATGYPFYYHASAKNYVRKQQPRTRLFSFHSNLIINLLPHDCDIESVNYITSGQGTVLTDQNSLRIDISDPAADKYPS